MKYRLTRHAQQDLRKIRNVIAADNPSAATRVIEAIQSTLTFLSRHPRVGTPREELGEHLRAFPAKRPAQRHVIFFQVEEETLLVKRVLHGARDLPAAFDE